MGDANKTNTSESTPTGPGPAPKPTKAAKHSIQAPKGTRDLYPQDAALRRFITEHWRNASIRHGFEEIDGPTFEDANLYKVKSGDGILAETFGVFSGKSPEDVATVRETGEAPLVLRPEFTPTLARMYAARAAQLGKPTKWFTAGPFFRAERPQRGRLREFLQWNVDFIGLPAVPEGSVVAQDSVLSSGAARANQPNAPKVGRLSEPDSLPPSTKPHTTSNPTPADPLAEARADAECIACCYDLLRGLDLPLGSFKIKLNDRRAITALLQEHGVPEHKHPEAFTLFDTAPKLGASYMERAAALGIPASVAVHFSADGVEFNASMEDVEQDLKITAKVMQNYFRQMTPLRDMLIELGVPSEAVRFSPSIVRGLAYYTGMVFEVIADGERAVAGGGRYDNLIELFGGPPTPAVGFGMGDVVLANLLRDKNLLPASLTPPAPARTTPDAYVITPDPARDADVRALVASLRAAGLHARHSYKSTRNVGKLLKDAADARYAVILESPTDATIKDMTTGLQHWCPPSAVAPWLKAALAIHH